MMIAFKRFALLLGLWLVLTEGALSALAVGALTAAAGTVLSLRLLPPRRSVRLGTALRLLPGFAWGSLLGGIDVAWRALHPRLPLRPAWIAYPTRLPPGAARVTLGNELSLMPGTLAAGVHGDKLYIHCLDRDGATGVQIAAEERRIAESIGLTLDRDDG